MTPKQLLFAAVLPAVIAIAIGAVAWRAWRRQWGGNGAWGAPAALVLAYVAAHFGVSNRPAFPPRVSADWRLVIAAAIGAFGVLIALRSRKPAPVIPAKRAHSVYALALAGRWGIASAAIFALAHRRPASDSWTMGDLALHVAIGGAAAALFWFLLDLGSRRVHRLAPFIIILIAGAAGAPVLLFDGAFESGAKLSGALAAACAALGALALWRPRVALAPGGTAFAGLMLPVLWIDAIVWNSLDQAPWKAGVLAVSGLGVPLAMLPPLRSRHASLRLTIVALIATASAGTLGALAIANADWQAYGISWE